MIFGVLLGLVVIAVSLLVFWIKSKYSVWKNLGVPYEEPHFIYGNLKGVQANQHEGELMQRFYNKFKGKAALAGVFFSFQPIALILDLALIKNVFIKDFNYFTDRGFYINESGEPMSAHLASLKGDKWKRLRHKFTPTFTNTKTKIAFLTMLKCSKKLESKITQVSSASGDFDAKDMASRYTIDIIAIYVFGLESNSFEDDNSEFFRIGRSVFGNPRHGTVTTFLQVAFQQYAEVLGYKNFRDEVSEFFTRITKQTIDYRVANDVKGNDFMDLLISMLQDDGENHITFNELLAQAFVFFAAGYETSSSTLQYCFFELVKNQDIQKKLRAHIEDVIGRHHGVLTFEALADMKYADQVVNETLRLYPPLSTITREATKDYQVPKTNIILKKGMLIMVPAYAIHYDPEYYPSPYTFDPERFNAANMNERPPETYLSFGIGPRNCIGGRMGMLQVKMGLIGALRNFQLVLSSKTKLPVKLQTQTFSTSVESPIWIQPVPLK